VTEIGKIQEHSKNPNLDEEVLVNLSYFEPMRFEQIILDFDNEFLKSHPKFDREVLMKILDRLVKDKKVKLIKGQAKSAADYQWQRIYPRKRTLWSWLPWRKK